MYRLIAINKMNKRNLKNVVTIAICIAASMLFLGCDEERGGIFGPAAGTTRETARLVTVGYLSSHNIRSDVEHWFRFVGTGEPVIFETRGNVVSTHIAVFEGDRINTVSVDSGSGEGYNALISVNTTQGTMYFIRVLPQSGTSGNYTFAVTAPFFNIRTNPIQVAVGYSAPHVINSAGTHWFRFQGTGNQVFFETEGNVVGTQITVFEGDATSGIQDNTQVSFITNAQSTYYISVQSRWPGAAGTYTFRVRHGTGDGSSRHNAIPVAVGNSSSHTFNLSTDIHWFTFFGTGESVVFETTGNVVATSIGVFARGDNPILWWPWGSGTGEGSNARATLNTDFGTPYFIRVQPQSGTRGTYTFVVR